MNGMENAALKSRRFRLIAHARGVPEKTQNLLIERMNHENVYFVAIGRAFFGTRTHFSLAQLLTSTTQQQITAAFR